MTAYHDLEIGLHRRDADSYSIELRLNQPPNDVEVRLMRDESPQVRFDRGWASLLSTLPPMESF